MLLAALLTLTLAPALAVMLLRGRMPSESSNPINRGLRRLYRPVVGLATRHPWFFVIAAWIATALTVPVYRGLGSEFMPPLYEESFLFMPITISGVAPEQIRQVLQAQDVALASIPEVERVFGKAGRAETATDPAPLSMIETTIMLKPRREWRPGVTQESLVREMEAKVDFPGLQNAFSMPIKARIDMLTTGIRTPVGVKVLGTDLAEIDDAAQRIEMALRDIETRSVYAERQRAAVIVDVVPRRDDLLRYGATVDDVLDVVDIGLGGMPVGRVFQGRERYSLIGRFGRDFRSSEEDLKRLPVQTALGTVPLGNLADVQRVPGPAMLVDEGGLLAAYVYVDPGSVTSAGTSTRRGSRSRSSSCRNTSGSDEDGAAQVQVRSRARRVIERLPGLVGRLLRREFAAAVPVPTGSPGGHWNQWMPVIRDTLQTHRLRILPDPDGDERRPDPHAKQILAFARRGLEKTSVRRNKADPRANWWSDVRHPPRLISCKPAFERCRTLACRLQSTRAPLSSGCTHGQADAFPYFRRCHLSARRVDRASF